MTSSRVRITLGCVALALLSACSGAGSRIGSTIKGDRVAVMEQTKSVTADGNLEHFHVKLPPMTANAGWPQAGFGPSHVMPNARLLGQLHEAWSESIGEGSDADNKLLARPVVAGGAVYTLDAHGMVKAFDARMGENKWEFNTTPPDADDEATAGGIGVEGSSVYATTGFGEVVALDAATGTLRWRHALRNPLRAAPTIADGRVYAVSIDNQLTALDAATGDEVWRHNGIVENATLMGASSPSVEGDSVIVAYSSGEVFDLRKESGRVSWNYTLALPSQAGTLPAIADIRGLPVISGNEVFVISHSGRIASIDHRAGDRNWEADVGGINTPLAAGNAIFLLSNEGNLVALTRDSGRIVWVQNLQKLSDPSDHGSDRVFWTGPVLAGDRLWLTNSLGQLASFSPVDGKPVASLDLGDPCYIPPVVAGTTLYVVTDDGELKAFR